MLFSQIKYQTILIIIMLFYQIKGYLNRTGITNISEDKSQLAYSSFILEIILTSRKKLVEMFQIGFILFCYN